MRAKSLFCLSDINITHVHCNIYSNIIQIEKIWKNIVYFCFKYAFVEDIEKAEKDSVSGPDNPDIPAESVGPQTAGQRDVRAGDEGSLEQRTQFRNISPAWSLL